MLPFDLSYFKIKEELNKQIFFFNTIKIPKNKDIWK